MSMSALQEEAELGEFFDFHNAVSDGGSMQTSGAFADPDHLSHVAERLAHLHVTHLQISNSKFSGLYNNANLPDFGSEELEAAAYSNFPKWIPRFIQPDHQCTYCYENKLACFLSYGKVTCTACVSSVPAFLVQEYR
jgi:hypothetical protein